MDGDRFDRIARLLAVAPTRRRALAAAAGAALAALAPGVHGRTAACGGSHENCGARVSCCAGLTCCAGRCIDTQAEEEHCGACDQACRHWSYVCESGACVCPSSRPDECGGRCVDLQIDGYNCGVCGEACRWDMRCSSGTCVCPRWAPDECGGRCVDRQTDGANCGTCGNACAAGEECLDGVCGRCLARRGERCDVDTPCCSGLDCCGGRCRDLRSDTNHCGACGHACGDDQGCATGECYCYSVGHQDVCGGDCADLRRSERHCGTCGNACRRGERCSYDPERGEARCCPEGRIFCAGRCVACDRGGTCLGDACRCPVGTTTCGGRCVDPQTNWDHCGRCGHACADGEDCSFGHCCRWRYDWCRRRGRCQYSNCDSDWGDYWDPDRCQCILG